MRYYSLRSIIDPSRDVDTKFDTEELQMVKHPGRRDIGRIPIRSNGRPNNFGIIISELDRIFPSLYVKTRGAQTPALTNTNQERTIAWYIDGSVSFTLKENLPENSGFSIQPQHHHDGLWISKPSSLYIGSGGLIKIGSKEELIPRGREKYGIHYVDSWVLQPLITDLLFWGRQRVKFDLRFHVVLYSIDNNINALLCQMGVARKCVNPHDVRDPTSLITNISAQEQLKGYNQDINVPLVLDDAGIVETIMNDLSIRTKGKLKLDARKKHQIILLGLDIMFSSDGQPILIEVNDGPTLDLDDQGSLWFLTYQTIYGIFGQLIPSLLKGEDVDVDEMPLWKKIDFHTDVESVSEDPRSTRR